LEETCRVQRAFREGKYFHVDDETFWRRDRTGFTAEYHSRPMIKDGKIAGAVATFMDVSARKQAEEKLRQAAIVFQGTNEAVIVTDAANRIVTVNRAFTEITGYEPHEVVGKRPTVLQSGRQDGTFYQQIWDTLQQTGHWQGEIWDRRKTGEVFPAWESISVVMDDKGRILNYVAILSDISMIKHAEEKLRYLAHHDVLTGLANRLLFSANLDQALEEARRHRQSLALLFLDLDHFKRINDTLGHAVGDRLLQEVAQRLRQSVRGEDTVARLGGDEFTVIMRELAHPEDAALLADKLLATFRKPIVIDNHEIMTSVSIGISVFPDNATDSDELTKTADAALYRAKERGRNTYEFYTPELTASALEHLAMEQALRAALAHNEFELYYQPQIDLPTGEIARVEALLRWRHPQRGLLDPESFMAVAEDSGLIEPIGEWVLRAACERAVAWRAAGLSGRVAINLSGRQVVRAGLVDRFEAILRDTGALPAGVEFELELTESVLHRVEQSRSVLERLKGLGVRLAVDDFGAGYSSLAHLRHLPIDTLKIDRSFVEEVPHSPDARSIVEAIITLGHGLRLTVVAEGVETTEQEDFLRTLHCDYVQGHLYGRAVPVDVIEELLAAGRVHTRRAREAG
jgi:diguanylate cyclase (GGDEF)-like protein/PAS domain S-box-containing protein